MRDQTFMTLVKLLPRSAVSTLVGKVTRAPVPPAVHQAAMKAFARRYRVSVEEAEHEFSGYRTFGDFFARRLKEGLRPIAPGDKVIVSPVDGAVSQAGYATAGACVQAKGIDFPITRLIGGDEQAARPFHGGAYATLYLSPRDYHRIHAPLAGRITGYTYIPGEFWPVNPISVRMTDALFCLNERLVTLMDTAVGKLAVVAVGATCVSRIKASYVDLVTHQGQSGKVHTFAEPIKLEKGAELGLFEMGSTVILLFETDRVKWDAALTPEAALRMGQRIGEAK